MYIKHPTQLILLWAQLTKIYPLLPTSVQPISITKTLLIVPTKNERDPPLFTGKLLIQFQNILRNTTQVIIRHRVKILFSFISSPRTTKVKIVKNERDPPLFTGKLLIKFQNILRNTTQVIVRHRICLQTDGQTWWNQYTPLQLRCGGYNEHHTTRSYFYPIKSTHY
jgi:hypothetical protein